MADSKITALTAISTVDPTADPLVIVDVSDTSMAASGTTKKSTINQLLGAGGTATLASATITGDLTVDTSTLKVDSTLNKVGIGVATLTGLSTLNVAGDIALTSDLVVKNSGGTVQGYIFGSSGLNYRVIASNPHVWQEGGTEQMRLNTTGNLVLKGGTAAATGVGVTFPAAQIVSSDANCLDDYEEGVFTPTVGGTATYLGQVGRYTKIGNRVFFNIRLIMGVIGTGSQSTISGLPFAVGASSDLGSVSVGYFTNLLLNVFYVSGFTVNGTSNIVMNATTAASGSITTPALVIGNNTDLVLSGFYTV